MNRDDVIRMAREAGFDTDLQGFKDGTALAFRLAALVAAHERELCIKDCDSVDIIGADECIKAIRARGKHD